MLGVGDVAVVESRLNGYAQLVEGGAHFAELRLGRLGKRDVAVAQRGGVLHDVLRQLVDTADVGHSLVIGGYLRLGIEVNLLTVPFMKVLTKLATLIVPESKKNADRKKSKPSVLKYVDERLLSSPSIAIEQFRRELMRMMDIACKNLDISMTAVIDADLSNQAEFDEADKLLSSINSELIHYLIELSGQEVDLDTETEIATYHKAVSEDVVADTLQVVDQGHEYRGGVCVAFAAVHAADVRPISSKGSLTDALSPHLRPVAIQKRR